MCFNTISENKILVKISEFTVRLSISWQMIHMKCPGLIISKINKDMRKFVICCKVIGALNLTVHLSLADESLLLN